MTPPATKSLCNVGCFRPHPVPYHNQGSFCRVCYIEPNNPAEAVKLATVQQGDRVRVHYTGRLDDGEVFDSSEGGTPLAFTVGSGQVIPGFDQGVLGMSPGDAKTVHIPCADAYGEHQSDGIMNVPRDEFPSASAARKCGAPVSRANRAKDNSCRLASSPLEIRKSPWTPIIPWPAKT